MSNISGSVTEQQGDGNRRNGNTPVGYSGQAALKREQYDMTSQSQNKSFPAR
jgi:hypothetical protein